MEIAAFGASVGARRSRGLPEVHPEACEEERQNFRDLRHKREKRPFGGKREASVEAQRREGSLARKVAKKNWQDSTYDGITRKFDENAVAVAKLFFKPGGRKASGALWKIDKGDASLLSMRPKECCDTLKTVRI